MERPAVLLTRDWEITRDDIAWAAGLFEGEGCVHAGRGNNHYSLILTLTSTDKDVIDKFHIVTGELGNVNGPRWSQKSTKPFWIWSSGRYEISQAFIAMFWEWLGERRRSKAATRLLEKKLHSNNTLCRQKQQRYPEGAVCSVEGCDAFPRGRGLCTKHWAQWRKSDEVYRDRVNEQARERDKIRRENTPGLKHLPYNGQLCKVEGCELPAKSLEMCYYHYGKQWKMLKKAGRGWRLETQTDE